MMRTFLFAWILFYGLIAQAQGQVVEQVTLQMKESKEELPSVKPFLVFAQDKYAPGDTAFFRLYMLAENEKAIPDRSIFTLKLFDRSGISVLTQNIPSEKVGVANQLIVPESLLPGVYTLGLFGDQTTNFPNYSQELIITGVHRLEMVASNEPAIEFFPEGGHIAAGFVNRLILRANAPIRTCELRSKVGKVASILFNEHGLASIQFLPQPGESYWLQYEERGEKRTIALQESDPGQLTLRVYPGPRRKWILDIMGSELMSKKKVFLILVTHREIIFGQEIILDEKGRKQIFGAPDLFPEGLSEFFVLDADRHILAYRPKYMVPKASNKIDISGIPSETSLRQDICVELKITDDVGNPAVGAFAVSVINNESVTKPLITPDPSVVLHARSFQVDWSGSSEEIDMEMIANQPPLQLIEKYEKPSGSTNLSLGGRVYYKDSTSQLPYLSTILIYLHKDLIQYEATIEGNGQFYFPKIYDFLNTDLVYCKVLNKGREISGVVVEWSKNSGWREVKAKRAYAPGDQPDEYGIIRKQKKEIDNSYSFFLKKESGSDSVKNPNAYLEDEFQEADITILPKNYTPFETMREIILEIIPSLEFRVRQKDSVVRVVLMSKSVFVPQRYAEVNPLYVIDGWMTSDTRYLMKMSPQEIASFKIINDIGKLDRLGDLARDGVLFIQTKNPERTERDLTKNLLLLNGLSPTLNFSLRFPVDKRVPDLRTALYWNPQFRTNGSGTAQFSFRTSDVPGNYTIRIMATLDNGHLVATEQTFIVRFK